MTTSPIARRPPPPEFAAEHAATFHLPSTSNDWAETGRPRPSRSFGLDKLRERAASYDPLTRAYLRAIRDQGTPTAPAKVPKSRRSVQSKAKNGG